MYGKTCNLYIIWEPTSRKLTWVDPMALISGSLINMYNLWHADIKPGQWILRWRQIKMPRLLNSNKTCNSIKLQHKYNREMVYMHVSVLWHALQCVHLSVSLPASVCVYHQVRPSDGVADCGWELGPLSLSVCLYRPRTFGTCAYAVFLSVAWGSLITKLK